MGEHSVQHAALDVLSVLQHCSHPKTPSLSFRADQDHLQEHSLTASATQQQRASKQRKERAVTPATEDVAATAAFQQNSIPTAVAADAAHVAPAANETTHGSSSSTQAVAAGARRQTSSKAPKGSSSSNSKAAAAAAKGPSRAAEQAMWAQGHKAVAGVDEAGRGPLAGPVVAAAAVLPEGVDFAGLNDSKQMSEEAREQLYGQLTSHPDVKWAV
jgi:hypothetical protein